jgi:hypothetical protein
MTPVDTLVLRDIHQPVAPPWWPPAPGWWLVAAVLFMVLAVGWWLAARRRRRQRAIVVLFDAALAAAPSPAAQVAVMSEFLRRAARGRDPTADRYEGEAWLRFLDADRKQPQFSTDVGRLLLEGGFRRDVDADAVAALLPLARQRYLAWMSRR